MNEQQHHWISELRKFSICQLADALGSSCPIETGIRPIDRQFRTCGPALTVQCAPGDNLTLHHALHLAQPGDALIVAGSPSGDGALWGELMSISAQSKCLSGTIIDGPVRDPVEIQELGYPVFCREFNPRRAAKEIYGRINVPLRIGKISVQPRDLVLADANGIICIPFERLQGAVRLASDVAQKETEIKDAIRLGHSIFEVLDLEQYITADQKQGVVRQH
jgi:4-hydroxy-4-methyl-2-oxoglutarate aldolase